MTGAGRVTPGGDGKAWVVSPSAPFRMRRCQTGVEQMKKLELETLFMDCDRLKAMCEQMQRCRPCTPGSASGRPQARLQRAPRDPQAPGPTPEDIRYNRG